MLDVAVDRYHNLKSDSDMWLTGGYLGLGLELGLGLGLGLG